MGIAATEPNCFDVSSSRIFFPQYDLLAERTTKMSICGESVAAMVREHSMSGVGPIGAIMAVDLPRADARRDVAGCVLEQKLETLHPRAVIGHLVLSVSSCVTRAAPARLCGEGAS